MVAGTVGGVLGGLPSTAYALATGNDPFRATVAAGTLVLPHERRRTRLLPAAALAHGSISVLWGMALALILPRRRSILAGSVAGLGIAALDLGIIGRRLPGIQSLPVGPQIADHVAFGAAVGAVLAIRDAERVIPAPPAQIFEFLSDLRNHWKLEDCFAQLDTLQSGHGSQLRGGTVAPPSPR